MITLVFLHLNSAQTMAFAHAYSTGTFRLRRGFFFGLLSFPLGPSVLKPNLDLRLGEIQKWRQLFALRSHDVVVLFEGVFQVKKLRRCEGSSDSLGPATCHKTFVKRRRKIVRIAGKQSTSTFSGEGCFGGERSHVFLTQSSTRFPRVNWCFSSTESDGKLSLSKLNKLQPCRKMRSYAHHHPCISLVINLKSWNTGEV